MSSFVAFGFGGWEPAIIALVIIAIIVLVRAAKRSREMKAAVR